MSSPENVNYWLQNVSNAGNENVTRSFWNKLSEDLQNYVNGFNKFRNTQTLVLKKEDGHSLEIFYEGHSLNILFDFRTGHLQYWFVTSKLAKFFPDKVGVTAKGEIRIDPTSGSFRASSRPEIKLGTGSSEARTWPVHDRLAQYLLQKLLVPDFADARFEATP